MRTSEELAQAIYERTHDLIKLAQQGELDAFYTAMDAREHLLAELEGHIEVSGDQARTQTLLIEARGLNQQLQDSLTSEQKKLLDERSRIERGGRMKKAYSENQ